ncbi:methionine ABC transporter ATP-binding protein [Anaerolentibacter hominis]|uniref:methionine ABC transporter ATP-binding protein n=1 Tax=Anaerolentibacter hominis TaxID=3079009 RepID=UPI0031B87B49
MEPMIRLEHITKKFMNGNAGITVLNDISLSVDAGEIYGIIGSSGAGKSTLVRCMNFLEKPQQGQVYIEGKLLNQMSPRELNETRQSMGMIFQQFGLLMQRTALDNVCLSMEIKGISRKNAREKGKELLELVGMPDKMYAYPSQLSGGQKQRVAIARALAVNPKILFCDEATSALDPTTTQSILELLENINQQFGITIVMITHQMEVVERICRKVAVLDGGKIAEEGPVSELFASPETEASQRLIYKAGWKMKIPPHSREYRIVFDGLSSYQPVIADMVLECQIPVNILYADTTNLGGQAVGQMVIQIPDGAQGEITGYLERLKIRYEEVKGYA